MSLARAVPSVERVNIENETRNTGLRPYIPDNGACEKLVAESTRGRDDSPNIADRTRIPANTPRR